MRHLQACAGLALALALVTATTAARAQSLNVDFGLPPDAPAATYAAAGLPGVWNSIQGDGVTGMVYHLVDLAGHPTAVTLHQYGGMELRSAHDPSVTGDDARLLNDALITYDPGLESCLFVDGLEPGTYEVLMYAWMPDAPAVRSRVRHDLSTRTEDVGGAWTGAHVEGVTFARHMLVIGSDGFMGSHSGIVPGAVAMNGAALNGFQLRRIDPGTDAGTVAMDAGGTTDAGGARDAGARDASGTTDTGGATDAGGATDTGAMMATDGSGPPRMDASGMPGTDASGTPGTDASADSASTPPNDAARADAIADGGRSASPGGCACAAAGRPQGRGAVGASIAALATLALAFGRRRRRRAAS